jgi:CRISP-associated protein Cas1
MHLVLDTKGISMKVRNACFHIKTEQHERIISPQKLSSIAITTQCWLSSTAIRLAIQNKIPIYFHDGLGKIEGRLWSASFGHLSTLRRKQIMFAQTCQATQWVIELFGLKTQEQIENLAYLKTRKIGKSAIIDNALLKMTATNRQFDIYAEMLLQNCSASMMGKEGATARTYWQTLAECMPEGFNFDDRNRRPAQDNFNAALNYLYGMLYGTIESALFIVGIDPYLGFLHADEYNQPTLSFDMIEPFRPWVDRFLIEAILKNEVATTFFEAKNNGVWLSKAGKQYFIPRFHEYFEERCLFKEKMLSRKGHIYKMAADLAKLLDNFVIL